MEAYEITILSVCVSPSNFWANEYIFMKQLGCHAIESDIDALILIP
jgi:hypothetical protein